MLALTCYDSNLTGENEQYREWFGNLVNDVHVEKQGTRDIYSDFAKVYWENSSETMTTLTNYAFSTSNLKNENTNIANGSFEEDIHLGNQRPSKFTLCSPHWRTTETDHRIEIVARTTTISTQLGILLRLRPPMVTMQPSSTHTRRVRSTNM